MAKEPAKKPRKKAPVTLSLKKLDAMDPVEALEWVAKKAMTSSDHKEMVQGANLLIKLQNLREPEPEDTVSPFVRQIVTFLSMMVNNSGLAVSELLEKMTEKCADCTDICDPVFEVVGDGR